MWRLSEALRAFDTPAETVGVPHGLLTLSDVVRSLPFSVAFKVAVFDVVTGEVVIVKVATVCPASTVTVGGTCAKDAFEESVTIEPPTGAWLLKVTVPVALVPPFTPLGDRVKEAITGAWMVRFTDRLTDPRWAVISVTVVVATGSVEIGKVAEVAPADTVTDGGTVA